MQTNTGYHFCLKMALNIVMNSRLKLQRFVDMSLHLALPHAKMFNKTRPAIFSKPGLQYFQTESDFAVLGSLYRVLSSLVVYFAGVLTSSVRNYVGCQTSFNII
jgi:hypothetical protein